MYFSFPYFALFAPSIALQFPFTFPPFHVSNDWTYTDCGTPGDIVQLKSISLNPDPPSAYVHTLTFYSPSFPAPWLTSLAANLSK
jgi:signal peptidase I